MLSAYSLKRGLKLTIFSLALEIELKFLQSVFKVARLCFLVSIPSKFEPLVQRREPFH